MFKINTDLDNPSAPPRELTFEQLFDPRHNLPPHPFHFNKSRLQTLFQSFYSRDNILSNAALFFPHIGTLTPEQYRAFIAPIPDDRLYTIAFIQFTMGRQNCPVITPYSDINILPQDRANRAFHIYAYERDYQRCPYSYQGDNWGAWLSQWVNAIHDALTSRLFNNTSIPNDANITGNWGQCQLFYHYCSYLIGAEHCIGPAERYYNARSLLTALRDHPEARLTIRPNPFSCRLTIPITSTNRSALYQTYNYTTNPLDLLEWPITLKGEHKPLLYGIELEFSSDYPEKPLIDAAKDPFFILKKDSSVSGNRCRMYELCTIPMSYKAHRQQWAYWFKNLDYTQFDQTKDTSNGLHIHIGRDAFNKGHLRNFSWFFTQPGHKDFIFAVSERDQHSFREYSQIPNYPAQVTKSFLNNLDYVARIRGCVNLSQKNTVEVRLFRGIVSLAEILKNLEFVDSVFHFTQDASFSQLTLSNYYAWLQSTNRNRYSLLKKYFERIPNLDKLIASSDIFRVIHTERKPPVILERLAKSRLTITNVHVTILNQIFKKRVFVLNKDTKQLELSTHNHGKLSFLDRSLEDKLLRNTPLSPITVTDRLNAPTPPPPPVPPMYTLSADDFLSAAEELATPLSTGWVAFTATSSS
jgi:hypothetical protein